MWSSNTFKKIASRWGVLLDIDDPEETGFHSKRLCLSSKLGTNIFENFRINFHGKTYWIRAKEVPGWVPNFSDYLDEDESDTESKEDVLQSGEVGNLDRRDFDGNPSEIPETLFETDKPTNVSQNNVNTGTNDVHSVDPFNIYPILNKKNVSKGMEESSVQTPIFPPGFTPLDVEVNEQVETSLNKEESIKDNSESACSGHFKKSAAPRSQGSILNLMEELIKVGQTMGYNMGGCLNNLTQIIESQGETEGYR
ncbi:hypothetical protein Tco_0808835 [Tanacetum coccineum]